MTRKNLREKLIQKNFSTHGSLKRVFDEWRVPSENSIKLDRFMELMHHWGFKASEDEIRDLFNWLDKDQDGELSFLDLRETIGLDVSPKEAVYFR